MYKNLIEITSTCYIYENDITEKKSGQVKCNCCNNKMDKAKEEYFILVIGSKTISIHQSCTKKITNSLFDLFKDTRRRR